MADQANPAANAQAQGPTGQLAIQKIYVKDLSFEAPNTPGVFTEQCYGFQGGGGGCFRPCDPSVPGSCGSNNLGAFIFRMKRVILVKTSTKSSCR